MVNYALAVLIGLDVFVNAILGGRKYQTMSCRIGESLMDQSWASHLPLPDWFVRHCVDAVFETVV